MRLQAHGVANLALAAANGDDAGRARNRRVEMVVRHGVTFPARQPYGMPPSDA